jgi:hypothetical protein
MIMGKITSLGPGWKFCIKTEVGCHRNLQYPEFLKSPSSAEKLALLQIKNQALSQIFLQ